MSLLMEALKKAEQAKRDAQQPAQNVPVPSPVNVNAAAAVLPPAPNLKSVDSQPEPQEQSTSPAGEIHLELEMHAHEETRLDPLPQDQEKLLDETPSLIERETIPEPPEIPVDEVKKSPPPTPAPVNSRPVPPSPPRVTPRRGRPSASRRRLVWWSAGLIAVLIAALGFYQLIAVLDKLDTGLAGVAQSAEQSGDEAEMEADTSVVPAEVVENEVAPTPSPPAVRTAAKPVSQSNSPALVAETAAVASTVMPSPPPPAPLTAPAPLHIVREQVPDPVYTVLRRAYAAYQAGSMDEAERQYRLVIGREANNRDALLGLAAVAQRGARLNEARGLYARLLELNPKDSAAIASLMAMDGNTALTQSESRLKFLIDQEPAAAHLHFALGSLYVAQSRWAEAQQAFFNAYHYDSDNGDYVFNLAVSLDRLGQGASALPYYRLALAAAAHGAVQYDSAALNKRIDNLSRDVQ